MYYHYKPMFSRRSTTPNINKHARQLNYVIDIKDDDAYLAYHKEQLTNYYKEINNKGYN